MRPQTRIVYAETLANPTTAVADLPALADIAHRQGALLVVDSTMAPPVICRRPRQGTTRNGRLDCDDEQPDEGGRSPMTRQDR